MKRTREESSAPKASGGEKVPLAEAGGEKSADRGSKVDSKRWVYVLRAAEGALG